MGDVELFVHEHSQVLLPRAALDPLSTQPLLALTHVQDFALGPDQLHEFHTSPPLQCVKVALDGITALQNSDSVKHLGLLNPNITGKLALSIPLSMLTAKILKDAGPYIDEEYNLHCSSVRC